MKVMAEQVKLDAFIKEEKVEKIGKERPEDQGPYNLPKGWKWVKIEEVVTEFQSGFACSKKYITKSGIPHLRPNNIGLYGELDLSHLVFIPPERVNLDKYSLKKGDVLFNNTNSKELVGRACLVKENLDYAFSNHITRLRVNKRLIATPEWLVLSINYLWLKRYFLSICRKWIGQAGVNTKMLKSIKIPLPPLEEQKRIVARIEELVSRAEEAKRLRRMAREEAEKIMQVALHKAFSRGKEEGWKWVRLGEIAKISAGGTPQRSIKKYWNGNIPWVKISDIPEHGLVLDTEEKITEEGLKNSSAKIFPRKTILFSIFATIAKVGILEIDAATNQAIAGIQIRNTKRADYKYLFYCLKNFGLSLFDVGRGMAQRNINQTILKNLKIPLPPLEEQKKIVAYLNRIRETVESLKKLQQRTEEELKKLVPAILDRAFKGEL